MSFLIAHLPYVLLMVISAGVMIAPSIQTVVTGGLEVSTHETTVLMNQKRAIIVDVRSDKDFQAGHIVNARHIPINELKSRVSELQKFQSRPLIIVGASARRALSILQAAGFKDLGQLKGGMRAWQEAGLPSEKSTSPS
jgi:rhodanese-related sulfurtransferase